MGENTKKPRKSEKTPQIFQFSAKIFNLFVKVTFQCHLMGKENGDDNPEKKSLRKGFQEIVEKIYKKSEFRGKKDTVGKETPGFPNL